MLLTQAENQGLSGLSTQLCSGKICGDQWLLELARPGTEKLSERTLWRWLPASAALLLRAWVLHGPYTLTPVSAERTHSHVANVSAASGSTWPPCQCVRPLLIRKSCSFCRHVHCLSWHHSLAKALQKMEMNGGMYPLCCQNDILVSHCSFADFFLEWLQMLKNNEMLSLGRQNGRQ